MTHPTDTFLPNDEDVAFYRENGYWISPPILTDEVLDAAERGMRRHHTDDVDRRLPGDQDRVQWGWRPGDGEVLRKNDYASLRVEELALLVRQPVIAACAARLAGAAEIRLWHDQLLCKPSGSARQGHVGWHTDRQYWRSCSSAEMLTAWIPFHDIGASHGPVMFLAGSHRLAGRTELSFFDQDLTTIDRYATEQGLSVVSATLGRGQVSFHHCRTIHGSGPNHSGEPRRSIAVHLQPGDNHHVAGDASHRNDALTGSRPDGSFDYADPAVCPRLWPSAA